MTVRFSATYATGQTLVVTLERISDGFEWREAATQGWEAAGTSSFANRKITLTEGSADKLRCYLGSSAGVFGDAGWVRVRLHDDAASDVTLASPQIYIWGGVEVNALRPLVADRQADVASDGVVNANFAQILGTAITGTAALLAAAITKFFNVATPTGTVNSLPDAVPGASSGLLISGTNSGTTTLGALTVSGVTTHTGATVHTGAVTMAGGLAVTQSASNTAGVSIAGNGSAAGLSVTGGATGNGVTVNGGGTSGKGIAILTTSGDGLSSLPTAGHGIVATGNGASKHGLVATGGTSGTSDGLAAVAGTGGIPIRGAIEALGTQAKADVNAEVVDVLTVDTMSELGVAAPTATPTFRTAVMLLYMWFRNGFTVTGGASGKKTLLNDSGTAILHKAVADDGTTYTESESASGA